MRRNRDWIPFFPTKTIMQKLETQVNNNLKQEKYVRDR